MCPSKGSRFRGRTDAPVNFSLEGIGVELAVQGVFSFVGKAAFFKTDEASGFRGSLKLSLDSVGLAIDVGIMVGRMTDGTFFFYLFIDVELPVGIPLFSTGAALYGFAGLLAVNLQPARARVGALVLRLLQAQAGRRHGTGEVGGQTRCVRHRRRHDDRQHAGYGLRDLRQGAADSVAAGTAHPVAG